MSDQAVPNDLKRSQHRRDDLVRWLRGNHSSNNDYRH
jgi:hypothetical protein